MSQGHTASLPQPAHNISSDKLAAIALKAGAIIMRYFKNTTDIIEKADDSPVTEADHKAEALILAELAILAPDLAVLAEEEVAAGRIPELGDVYACVDPLDGTREFINHRKDFTVNIAIISDEKPIAGVIYAPAHGWLYMAHPDCGAWFAEIDAAETIPHLHQRQTLAVRKAPAAITAIASRSHQAPETRAFLDQYTIANTVSAGSSLKFCMVAQGKADIYPRLGRTMEWDTAAGQAIVEAAGGKVLTKNGKSLSYKKTQRGYDNPHFIVYGDHDLS